MIKALEIMGLGACRLVCDANVLPAQKGLATVKNLILVIGSVLALEFLVIGGCGPFESTTVIIQADVSAHNAKTADGDKKSPYEYTAAEQYLRKAREKWGTSDFEYAVDYARKARELAEKARERSLKNEPDAE